MSEIPLTFHSAETDEVIRALLLYCFEPTHETQPGALLDEYPLVNCVAHFAELSGYCSYVEKVGLSYDAKNKANRNLTRIFDSLYRYPRPYKLQGTSRHEDMHRAVENFYFMHKLNVLHKLVSDDGN